MSPHVMNLCPWGGGGGGNAYEGDHVKMGPDIFTGLMGGCLELQEAFVSMIF